MRADFLQKRPTLWAILTIVGGVLVFSGFRSGHPGLISHPESILRLPLISWWGNLSLIFSRDFLGFTEGHFRPLGYAFLAVVRTFVPPDASFFWRLGLVGLHAINALLVFSLARFFTSRIGPALLSGLVFALHTLASVVAGQVVHFPYLLGLAFLLASLRVYLTYDQSRNKWAYGAALLLFLLSLMTCKAGAGLPLFILAYEGLYRRKGLRAAFVRSLFFAGVLLVMAPFWLYWKPHPLLYRYPEFSEGAGWNSFISMVGASGLYFRGLLWGGGVPVVLHEAAEQIFRTLHWKFLLWGVADLFLLSLALWSLRRKIWAGLGVILIFCGMLPFASTSWNGVEAYLAWPYLYLPAVGLALTIGGLTELLLKAKKRVVRIAVVVAGCVLIAGYGIHQSRLNGVSRSELSYWEYAYRLKPTQRASLELGKAHLRQGDEEKALAFLFSPYVEELKRPSRQMSRFYSEQGDLTAAAVHLYVSAGEDVGLQFQDYEMAQAIAFQKAGAPDYSEDALARVLTGNPFNAEAVVLLAEVWTAKKYMNAAQMLLTKALKIAPSHPKLLRAVRELNAQAQVDPPCVIHPPAPSWLRYALQNGRDEPVRREIVRASDRHPADPVLQLEAGICLMGKGKADSVLAKMDFASGKLSSCAYIWATKCWVEIKTGASEKALSTGERALELDPRNAVVHRVLGLLYEKTGGTENQEKAIRHYEQAIQLDPRSAVANNNLGSLFVQRGALEEAEKRFREAIRLRSDYAKPHYNLGTLLMKQGKFGEAILSLRETLHLQPGFVAARSNLGVALLQMGRLQEAEHELRRVLRSRPALDGVWKNLGRVFTQQGRFREALELFREWRARVPDRPEAALSLAWLLATCPDARVRDGAKAFRLAEAACRAGGYRSPGALGVLAAACAEEGRYEEAMGYARKAFRLARESGMNELVRWIEEQLGFYRTGRPYRTRR